MAQRIDADVSVSRLGIAVDGGAKIVFPHADIGRLVGSTAGLDYEVGLAILNSLEGRFDSLRWQAEGVSLSDVKLSTKSKQVVLEIGRCEATGGFLLVRGENGLEIMAPHVALTEVKLIAQLGQQTQAAAAQQTAPSQPRSSSLRQEKLRFLDGLAGHVALTVRVSLDLPVIGTRTLDQALRVDVRDGCIDYRALDSSLDWLEGTFLDVEVERGRLAVTWGVPVVAPSRDIVSCALDDAAQNLAAFGKVPVRSFADFRVGQGSDPQRPTDKGRKKSMLRSLVIDAIDVALGLTAPRSLEVGNGLILFGGDDAPGMLDCKISGQLTSAGVGKLLGEIHLLDTTLNDIQLGGFLLNTDRLSFDRIEQIEVQFDAFRPKQVSMTIHRATATNVALRARKRDLESAP